MKKSVIGGLVVLLLGAGVFGLYTARARGAVEPSEAGDFSVADLAARKNGAGYTDLSADELAGIIQIPDVTVINVHIPFAGDLPDTDTSIPFNQITRELDRLPSKDEPIVLYCLSGGMSTSAAHELVSMGYTQVMELNGGMRAWNRSGREILR